MSGFMDEIRSVNPFKAQMVKRKPSIKLEVEPVSSVDTASTETPSEAGPVSTNPFKAQMIRRTSFTQPAGTNLSNLEKSPKREERNDKNPYQNVLKKRSSIPPKSGAEEGSGGASALKVSFQGIGGPGIGGPGIGGPGIGGPGIGGPEIGSLSGSSSSNDKPPLFGNVKAASSVQKTESPLQKRRQSKVFDFAEIDTNSLSSSSGAPKVPQSPGNFNIVTAIQDKRLVELKESYNEKFNQVVFMNDQLNKQVGDMQRKLKEASDSQKKVEDTATKNYLMIKTESDKNEKLHAENMQLVKELQVERASVERLSKEKAKLEADSQKHEAELASKFSSEYHRLKQAFEMMQSRYESKNQLLSQKCEELDRMVGANFELGQSVEMLKKLARQTGDPINVPATPAALRLTPRLAPVTPPKGSMGRDTLYAPQVNDDSDYEDDMEMVESPAQKLRNSVQISDMPHPNAESVSVAELYSRREREHAAQKTEHAARETEYAAREIELRRKVAERDETIERLLADMDQLNHELSVLKFYVTGKDESGKLEDSEGEMGENESKKRMNRFYKKCVCLALNGGNNGTDAIALADVCALLEGNALSLQCIPRSENERQLTVRLIEYLTIKQQQWLLQSMKELEPDDSFPLMRKAQMQFNIETQASRDDTSVGSNMMANYASESDSSHAPERPSSGTKRNRGHNEMNGFGPLAQPWGSQSTEACKSEINIDIETLLASKGLLSSLPAGVTLNILANTPKNSEDAHLSSTIKASRRLSVPKVVTNDGIEVPLLDLKGASPSNNQKSPKSHKVLKSDKSPKNSKSPKNEAGKAERRSGSDTNSPANLTKKTFWSSDDEVERVIQKPAGASIDLAHTPSKAPTRRHTVASVGGFTGQSPRRPPPPSPIMEPRTQQLTQNLALPEEALVIKSVQSTVDSWPIDVKQNNQLDDVSTLQLSNDANKKRSQSEHVLVEETEIPRTQHSPKFSSAPSVNRRPSAPTMSPSTPVAPKVDIATPTHAGFGRSSSLSNTPSTSSISSMFNDNDVLSNMQISTTMSSPRPSPAPAPKSIRVAPEVNAIMPTPSKRGSSKLATSLTSPMTDERSSTDSGHRSEHSNRLQIQRESIERRQSSSPEDCHMGNHSPIFTGKGLESDATRSQHFAVNVAKRAKPIVTPPLNSRHGSRTAESLQPHSEGRRLTVAKFTEISSEPDNNYEYYQSSAPRALVDDYDPQSSYYSDDEYDNSSNMQGRVMPYEVVENIKRPLQSFSHTAPIEKRQLAESFSEQPQRIQSSPSKPMRHYVSDFRESSPQSQDMVMHESVARQRSRERLQDSKRSGSFRGYYDREGPDRRLANEAVQSADSYGTIQDNKKNSDQLGFERGSGHYVAHHSRAKLKTDLQYDESVGLDSEISSDDYYGAVRKQQVKQVHQDPQFRLRSQTTRYGLDGRDLSCVHKYSSAGDEYNEGSPRSDTEGYEYPDY